MFSLYLVYILGQI